MSERTDSAPAASAKVESQRLKPERSESALATIILALIAVAVAGYALLYGLQTMTYFEARHWAARAPYLWVTPQPLASTISSPPQERHLFFYRLEFSAPWKGVAKTIPSDNSTEVDFKSGPAIVIFDPANEPNVLDELRSDAHPQAAQLQQLFGPELFPTNYDLYAAAYGASPAALSPVMNSAETEKISALLLWKLSYGLGGTRAIYNVHTDHFRGFQFGDPSTSRGIREQLFDKGDHQLRILFTSKTGQAGSFSQADINCVIESLTPVPATQ